ncbi:cytochrome P450 [Nocardia arizonensis]|uniref:cytochrome P450 n=1 Tax=Nocardia arizonensis TaxID=1141647 RepID=UPI0009E8F64D|nr:cytochrome P450 [Nocardia arizonensis]
MTTLTDKPRTDTSDDAVVGREAPTMPGALPLVGHIPMIARSRFDLIDRASTQGPVCKVLLGPHTAYFVNDYALLAEVLVSDASDFVRGVHFEKMRNIVGNGVVTTSGDLHRKQRRVLLPSFTQRRLEIQMPIMRRIMADFVSTLPEGTPHDIMEPLLAVGCDISASSLFGEDVPADKLELIRQGIPVFVRNAAIHALDVTGMYKYLPTKSNRDFKRLLGAFDDYVFDVIDKRMAHGPTGRAHDLLDTLVTARDPETGEAMSRQEIRDQAVTILFASTETTANTITWCVYELARHPRWAEVCRSEIAEFGGADGGIYDLQIGRNDLPTIKRCLMESLRLYPSSYLLSRQAKRDLVLGGFRIPAGATILYSHYGQQRNEDWFSHADEFDPQRWSEENTSEVTPKAYMPFGFGAYRCLGETVATIESMYCIAMLLSEWNVSLARGSAPAMNGNITLSPRNLEFVFTRR